MEILLINKRKHLEPSLKKSGFRCFLAYNREYNKKHLGELRSNVDLHMNPGMAQMGLNTGYSLLGANAAALSMDSMAEFVNSRLADDLTLIQ